LTIVGAVSPAGGDFSEPIIAAIERKVKAKGDYPHDFTNRHLAII